MRPEDGGNSHQTGREKAPCLRIITLTYGTLEHLRKETRKFQGGFLCVIHSSIASYHTHPVLPNKRLDVLNVLKYNAPISIDLRHMKPRRYI